MHSGPLVGQYVVNAKNEVIHMDHIYKDLKLYSYRTKKS